MDDLVLPDIAAGCREVVKGMFVKSYEAYRSVVSQALMIVARLPSFIRKYAWGHDDFARVSCERM
jgi:hypothetical protein